MLKMDATLNGIIDLARRDRSIDVVWLYGSRAKGVAHARSDYDLAVAFTILLKMTRWNVDCDRSAWRWIGNEP
ncbi:nucleotidyltransferase domain-containing protein [Methylotuvimicrobium sp. KM1]|uniref:nucleotidyltransferase domain-containing protein n=1 Tax=Methylotuvimicrobium sp. KM1 TaxID=3377707 RepID=UPI00384C9757